ncbi:MAG: cobyrinate a,c-diamide synthase [Planctomycetota bacterium]
MKYERAAIPRVVLGGASSGAGKTTVAIALIAALRRRGLDVAPFKAGPDYLDPGHHRLAAGRPSWNVDGWMMGRDAVLGTFTRAASDCDIAIVEGVMGLFDGASAVDPAGSTAEVADWLAAPVLLVADAGGMARTFAALCRGFQDFDGVTNVEGSIANRLGSEGHLDLVRRACAAHGRTPPVLGGLPRDAGIELPERHLGLVTADPELLSAERLERLAQLAERWIDIDRVLDVAAAAPPLDAVAPASASRDGAPSCRIAIAQDDAFQFYYEENLHLLEAAGAELVPFSPIADAHLPDVDGVYLGGGYPELFAEELAANRNLREELLAFAREGRPVYAECGGMMLLQRAIRTLDGAEHEMAGVFDGTAVMQPRRVALGYAEVEVTAECLLGPPGTRFRGHQFRYSDVVGCTAPSVYRIRGRRAREAIAGAYATGGTVASYVHGHWASHPAVARRFVSACAEGVGA